MYEMGQVRGLAVKIKVKELNFKLKKQHLLDQVEKSRGDAMLLDKWEI